ncbi:MAG: retron system putative HNH endonuclease [Phascolarctobacterium sp.]|nr:retron system putative HNH endonuclease [Phascolarctobacterium sp.]
MKRVYKRDEAPPLLTRYKEKFPHATWEQFRRHCKGGYPAVKQTILEDQHYLCAYCEISIKLAENEDELDDFRVEHFYPKQATEEDGHNFHLDWRNLIGVCHGGSQPAVPDAAKRFSTYKGDHSCDVPKGGKEITSDLLNPMHIPAKERLFRYVEFTGKMVVDEESCPKYLQRRAENTIRELNLNAPRLMRMRKTVINGLREEIAMSTANGEPLEDVLNYLAQTSLLPDIDNRDLSFFSVIRWYLGDAAEKIIKTSGRKI